MWENEKYKSISLCNIGIIEADKYIDEFMDDLGNPEKAEKMDFDYKDNDVLLNQEQKQEQEQIKQLENVEQEGIDNGEQVKEK